MTNEVKKLKDSKAFKAKTNEEQKTILSNLLYEKIISNEKEKIFYFLLTYGQKTLLTKTGEKQDEKAFLGYEFSKSRGHEGIKMLPEGTRLYDETDQFNSEKANYYVYSAFQKSYPDVDDVLQNNIEVIDTHELLGIQKIPFEKHINLNANIKVSFDTKYPKERLSKNYDVIKGVTYDKKDQVYRETGTAILTADNITLENYLEIVKTVYLDEAFETNDNAKLLKNDIFMCLSSGSRKHIGKIAYINDDLPYFAGGFMGIVRQREQHPETTLLPKYIYSVLSMPNVRMYMGKICTGNNIKNLNDNDLKKQAHKMIQSFKTCLKPLSCTATSHNGVIPDLFVSKEMTFRDFIYRNRNIQKKEHGIDLQIDPEIKQLAFTSRYYVEELDIDTNSFKEMTLIDMDRRMPLIVDLTLCQAKRLKEISLKEGSIIIATVISSVSTVGQTEEWLLLKLHDVYRETIDRAELEHYIQLLNTQQAKQ